MILQGRLYCNAKVTKLRLVLLTASVTAVAKRYIGEYKVAIYRNRV
jgi:hypothetical protein